MRREYLWALMTLIIAIALALVLLSLTNDPRSQPVPELQQSAYDRKLDRLDRRGTEAAYTNRVALLYTNWMTDTTQASQDRALRGHRNARKIYIEIMTAIDARDPEGKVAMTLSTVPVTIPAGNSMSDAGRLFRQRAGLFVLSCRQLGRMQRR